jgi:hypothetical protein
MMVTLDDDDAIGCGGGNKSGTVGFTGEFQPDEENVGRGDGDGEDGELVAVAVAAAVAGSTTTVVSIGLNTKNI